MVEYFSVGSKEPSFISELKLVESENRLRVKLDCILNSNGMELPKTGNSTEFAVVCTVVTIDLILVRLGRDKSTLRYEERFVLGLFAFLITHELARRTLADLGAAFASSALEVFSTEDIAEIYQLGKSYSRLRKHKAMHRVLVHTISDWLNEPSEEHLHDLAGVFNFCCRPN
ncbi:hypothetical protein [Roseibium algae]|uniref:Uncharacterized protein n=1 Tax=Roseibium algae TaxID=3123038 RepID=A0ABU8TLW7_9HYPH